MDNEPYIQSALLSNPLREPTLREMVRTLHLPDTSRGLYAGRGIGLQCLLLAEEVGYTGHVTGFDISAEMVESVDLIRKKSFWGPRLQSSNHTSALDSPLWSNSQERVFVVGWSPRTLAILMKTIGGCISPRLPCVIPLQGVYDSAA